MNATAHSARLAGAIGVSLAVLALIWLGYAHCDCLFKQYDDAYITFRYAYNWAEGRGLVFNAGEPTDSASSFLYTVVLACVYRLGWHDLPRVATILGTVCAAAASAVTYLACLTRTQRPWLALFLALALGGHGLISGWSVSGMETLFYTALVSLAARRLFIVACFTWADIVLVTAILLTRFEGAILLASAGLIGLHRFRRVDAHQRKQLLVQAGFVASVSSVFLLFKYLTYGTVLPHAFHLKTISTLYAPNPSALWDTWKGTALGVLVLAFCGLWTLPRRFESVAAVFFVGVSLVSLLKGPSADWARYSVHLLPLAVMLASVPLSLLARALPVLALLACGYLGNQSYQSFVDVRNDLVAAVGHQTCRLQIGAYLEAHRPSGYVLSSDIGAIAYAAPSVKFIDAVGLTSADVLKLRADGANVDKLLFEKRPVTLADTCGGRCDHLSDFAAHGWLGLEGRWLTPLPSYTYAEHLKKGKVLDICKSPDQLSFAVTVFELAP